MTPAQRPPSGPRHHTHDAASQQRLTRLYIPGSLLLSFDPDRRINAIDLQLTSDCCRLLADMTRVRLLMLLEREELSVAELSAVTQLAQPRVSTHLAKLKEAGLVTDRRAGVSVFYRLNEQPDQPLHALWQTLREHADDPLLQEDARRVEDILSNRGGGSWADTVAGDMERHYSPGRTWEATARALVQMIDPGDVIDIAAGDGVMAELLAPRARRMVCVDLSPKVVAAGSQRTASLSNVEYLQADMQHLPLTAACFDTVLMLHALTYALKPAQAISEAARVLRPGGRLLIATLKNHSHRNVVNPFGHRNLGFTEAQLSDLCREAGLQVEYCQVGAIERRPPHFAVITALAIKS
ncbi:MAG: metalloregulator ArsR/SmtB family transcription factor [Wenzhouxiangellaceae bacterium]